MEFTHEEKHSARKFFKERNKKNVNQCWKILIIRKAHHLEGNSDEVRDQRRFTGYYTGTTGKKSNLQTKKNLVSQKLWKIGFCLVENKVILMPKITLTQLKTMTKQQITSKKRTLLVVNSRSTK